ncbi:MAG TPA: hypothetical protein VMD58_05610 [Acidobacteriaceae bacterium]|nr:hypothetical protein [Acidobacteriaceae bacterium]
MTKRDKLNLTPLEKEIVTLKAVLDMINDMVNHETMMFYLDGSDSSIAFKTMTHAKFFNIILVDLLSKPKELFSDDKDYIERLTDICENPLTDNPRRNDDIQMLKDAVNAFDTWLSQTVVIEKSWFPSLELQIDLSIERKEFIAMCGNLCKHNFTQTTRQAKKFQAILKRNRQSFSIDKCLIALEDFQVQFNSVFQYHASTIAEFLNDIRWGIYTYAFTERMRCVENWYDEEMHINRYNYRYPAKIASSLGKACYWGLMNDVMRPPYIQKFDDLPPFSQPFITGDSPLC